MTPDDSQPSDRDASHEVTKVIAEGAETRRGGEGSRDSAGGRDVDAELSGWDEGATLGRYVLDGLPEPASK